MRERKLRIGEKKHGVLKQKDVKQAGVKQGLGVLAAFSLSLTQIPTGPNKIKSTIFST
jgi:hypothetical protein